MPPLDITAQLEQLATKRKTEIRRAYELMLQNSGENRTYLLRACLLCAYANCENFLKALSSAYLSWMDTADLREIVLMCRGKNMWVSKKDTHYFAPPY